MSELNFTLDIKQAQPNARKLPHTWSRCVGAGRAREGLHAQWQSQLKKVIRDCGFQYIRFHGLLHDDMCVVYRRDGAIRYNFQYIDSLFDFLLETGIRPLVELSFMPKELASGTKTHFWWKANITPPSHWHEWQDLVTALVTHWIHRYSLEEVRKWYFEVWNEPNLDVFWSGSKSQYFTLYQVTAQAIKAIDPLLRVGGPATSNFVPDDRFDGEMEDKSRQITHRIQNLDSVPWKGVWIKDFLEYCAAEHLPVDFVSTHPYPTDFALDGLNLVKGRSRTRDSLYRDLSWLRETVKNSAYPDAKIHLTEWSSSPSPRDYSHDFLPAASYVVRSNLSCASLADSLSYWVFTDIFEETGGGPGPFHGGFGLINQQGIVKPVYHAYRMLHALGGTQLQKGENHIITRRDDSGIAALFFNYPDVCTSAIPISSYPNYLPSLEVQRLGEPLRIHAVLTSLPPHTEFCLEILDEEHGTAAAAWVSMGAPRHITREITESLQQSATSLDQRLYQTSENGVLTLNFSLPSWGIALLSLV